MLDILISNDDGIHAPGINVLAHTLSSIANIYMVAPLEERSTTGHTLTLDFPLRVVKIRENVWGCSGFPADCTLMGIHEILPKRPDLVISGINRGANLGQDIYYSGTVAAAREACFQGIPSIAVSSVVDFLPTPASEYYYETAADFIKILVEKDIHEYIAPLTLLNINVPNIERSKIEGIEKTILGMRRYSADISKRFDFRKRPYYWIGGIYEGFKGEESSDCFVVDKNKISMTELNILDDSSDVQSRWPEIVNDLNWGSK